MSPAALELVHTPEQATALLADLVGIDSVNPALVPGSAGEAQIAAYVAAWLGDAGLDVEVIEPRSGRPSVVAIARGTGGGRSLMLNAHTDTVGVAGMETPHEPLVRDGQLYGRGAYDMKGGLAACMLAGAAAARGELAGDVLVAAVSDEEHASIGTQSILERFRPDAAIVTEPTAMKVCVAHKGFSWLRVTARGRAAHGSRPDLGADAIAHMGLVLARLRDLDRSLRTGTHPLLGGGSIHASMITGGQELSSYPELCVLDIERRTVPGEDAEHVRDQIEAVLEGVRVVEPEALLEAQVTLVRDPFEVDQEEGVVQVVARAAQQVTGAAPQVIGDSPWMDAAFIAAAGIPTVVFGPAGGGAHAVVEWADLGSVVDCAQALALCAQELCA